MSYPYFPQRKAPVFPAKTRFIKITREIEKAPVIVYRGFFGHLNGNKLFAVSWCLCQYSF